MTRRTWTTGDLRRVAEMAGTMPSRELRKRLRLSDGQLRYALRTLRSMGVDASARYWEPRMGRCPACGCMRSSLGEAGICEPCRLREQLAEVERQVSALLPRLDPAQRAVYESTEAERESRADPMPKPPPTEGMGAYERARAAEEHDAAVERWACSCLRRRVKAAQKRKERIRRKVSENESGGRDCSR